MKFKSFRNCCDIAAISRAEIASCLEKKRDLKLKLASDESCFKKCNKNCVWILAFRFDNKQSLKHLFGDSLKRLTL